VHTGAETCPPSSSTAQCSGMELSLCVTCNRGSSSCLGADLLKMSRDDLVQVCGPADGIRLFNAIKGRCVSVSQGSWLEAVTQLCVAGIWSHHLGLWVCVGGLPGGDWVMESFLQCGDKYRRRCWGNKVLCWSSLTSQLQWSLFCV
jgi:hypothetical protein